MNLSIHCENSELRREGAVAYHAPPDAHLTFEGASATPSYPKMLATVTSIRDLTVGYDRLQAWIYMFSEAKRERVLGPSCGLRRDETGSVNKNGNF